ncbi:MAG: hypothetical protein WDO69_23895 [Pseudomonadota bacterium]
MIEPSDKTPTLLRLEITFFVEGRAAKWLKFARKIGAKVDRSDGDASFGALPSIEAEGALYVIGGFHPTGKTPEKSDSVHWHMAWIAAPDTDAPERLRKRSAKVGGYPTVLDKIRENWPGAEPLEKFDANFTAVMDIEDAEPLQNLDTRAPQSIEANGVTISESFQSRSWAIRPALDGLTSMTFVQQDGRRQVHISGKCRASFTADFPAEFEARTWTTLKSLNQ